MANFNKVIQVGRITRDPECKSFANGGMVAKFGFAVSNRKKDQSGAWIDDPCFIDVECYNRGDFGKLADLVRDRCHKGSQLMVEGKLLMDSWTDKTSGQKRTKHKIVADNIQLLDPRQAGGSEGGEEGESAPAARSSGRPQRQPVAASVSGDEMDGNDIPF